MTKYILLPIFLITFAFSSPGHANPVLLWTLVKKASQGPVASSEWSQVSNWLAKDIAENIDWSPAGEESARVLMQRHNPELYDTLFGLPGDIPAPAMLVAPARPFFGMGNYGGSQRVLGTGFSGTVSEHPHKLSGVLVAVKTLEREHYEKHKLPFPPLEAELMTKLWHPNILRLYEAIMTPEAQYLIMELVLGSDLFTWAQNQGLIGEDLCKMIMKQVLAALDCMHRVHICHRDLKPENLLIDAQGTTKVIDFGLACIFDPNGKIDQYCGSPDYAAPEVLTETPYVGPEIDIWAIAVILYDLAVGDLPFQTSYDVVALRYAFPDDVELSQHFRDLIGAILQKPENRASLEQILAHIWFKDDEEFAQFD